ncbi:pyocin knob domain-containing protein [Paenibacillus dokdonensis]|uniref:pyocin knob domain-containing protein n=1 Tax=Paenibacillus dokdonensis TaxID=2567944 RepID=UPI0010A90BA1|nr:pyocin knob domain-containing protein [Paenibacillus dokdonensis]
MASNTPNLGLLKKDPATDGNETFNIKTMLNDNWDKIDEAVGGIKVNVPDASTTQKGIVQLSNATDGEREDVAATERAVKAAEEKAKSYVDEKPWQKAKLTHDLGVSINISNKDLNTVVTVGFYSGENLTNAPFKQTGSWYHVRVEAMAEGYVVQTASELNSTTPSLYMRICVNGTWGTWSQDVFQSGVDVKKRVVDTINASGGNVSVNDSWNTIIPAVGNKGRIIEVSKVFNKNYIAAYQEAVADLTQTFVFNDGSYDYSVSVTSDPYGRSSLIRVYRSDGWIVASATRIESYPIGGAAVIDGRLIIIAVGYSSNAPSNTTFLVEVNPFTLTTIRAGGINSGSYGRATYGMPFKTIDGYYIAVPGRTGGSPFAVTFSFFNLSTLNFVSMVTAFSDGDPVYRVANDGTYYYAKFRDQLLKFNLSTNSFYTVATVPVTGLFGFVKDKFNRILCAVSSTIYALNTSNIASSHTPLISVPGIIWAMTLIGDELLVLITSGEFYKYRIESTTSMPRIDSGSYPINPNGSTIYPSAEYQIGFNQNAISLLLTYSGIIINKLVIRN